MSDPENNDSRTVTDVLLSLEAKVLMMIKTISANDMNNKLILNALNKLNKVFENSVVSLPQSVAPSPPVFNGPYPSVIADVAPSNSRIPSQKQAIEINQNPIVNKKQVITKTELPIKPELRIKELKELTAKAQVQAQSNVSKIPVGQRITDNKGKDLFMADVLVTDLINGEVVNKLKTNAVGKWQTYLPVGKYSIHVSKITDSVSLNKIESLQEIEVTSQMKSLQLPIAIIRR